MKKLVVYYFLLIIYLELILQVVCFKAINFSNIFLLIFMSLSFAIFFTIITTISHYERINSIIFKIISIILVFIFASELIYYKIYESFFSLKGIYFVGDLKDGYDKIFLTMWQNIIPITLFIIPIIFIFIKVGKKIEQINKYNFLVLICSFLLINCYNLFIINYIDKDKEESYYKLYYCINRPTLNVKKFGLLDSSYLSVKRLIFGFNEKDDSSEDILTNKKTVLAGTTTIKYNETNIDFTTLIKNETNNQIKTIHEYFSNQTPTEKNKFTSLFKDKNVIFIVAESFDEIAIDKDLTPTLYELKNNGIKFNNYFAPKYPASTADGEYMLEWATLPIIGDDYSLIDMVYNTNPYLLPRILKNNNYKTYVYHNYFGYYNYRKKYFSTLNFDGMKYCGEGIDTKCDRFHGSDVDMMNQTIDDYIKEDKFFAYYITLSGHGSYDSSNFVALKHMDKVNNLNIPIKLKYYLAANIDFDIAMNKLVTKLKETKKLDDTVIVISSDHSPYYLTNSEVNTLSSIDRDNKFDRNRGSLIIYNSSLKDKVEVNKYAMNIDVLPTVLNMLGLEYDSKIMIGKDIMAPNTPGLVIFPDQSWANNDGAYDASSKQFISYLNKDVDSKYIEGITNEVKNKYQISTSMQYSDYYKYIFK